MRNPVRRASFYVAVAALLIAFCSPASAAIVNLFQNPGFEDGTEPWYVYHTGDYNVVTDPAEAHSGNSYATFEWEPHIEGGYCGLWQASMRAYPGVEYTLTVWDKLKPGAASGRIGLRFLFYNRTGVGVGGDYQSSHNLTDEWALRTHVTTAPPDTYWGAVYLVVEGGDGAAAALDDACFGYDSDDFTPPEVPTIDVTGDVVATDAIFVVYLNGEPIDDIEQPTSVEYGEYSICIEAHATGPNPSLSGSISFGDHEIALGRKWRAGTLPVGVAWLQKGYDDTGWGYADSQMWDPGGAPNAAFRRTVLWETARMDPLRENQWLPVLRSRIFLATGAAGIFGTVIREPSSIPSDEQTLVIEAPAFLSLLDRDDQATHGCSNYRHNGDHVETTFTRGGLEYKRFEFTYTIQHELAYGIYEWYAPLWFKSDDQITPSDDYTFTFWREANGGNVSDIPMVLPVTITGPVNGRQCEWFDLTYSRPGVFHTGGFGTYSMEERYGMAETMVDAGMNVAMVNSLTETNGVLDYYLWLRDGKDVKLQWGFNFGMNYPGSGDKPAHLTAHPEFEGRFYSGDWDLFEESLGYSRRDMTGKWHWCEEYLASAVYQPVPGNVFYDALRPKIEDAKDKLGDIYYIMWNWEYDTIQWSCFCDRCKAAFMVYAGIPGLPGDLSDEEIVSQYGDEWIEFRFDQVARHLAKTIKFAEDYGTTISNWHPGASLRTSDFDYNLIEHDHYPDVEYTYHFAGWPGCALPFGRNGREGNPYSIWQPVYPDIHMAGQTIVDHFYDDMDESMWKIWTLNMALGTGGGGWVLWLDSMYPPTCTQGQQYFLGEATRLINSFEGFFRTSSHIEDRFSQAGLEGEFSELIALDGPAGEEALVLLFNHGDGPAEVTVTLENNPAGWNTVQQWEGATFDGADQVIVTVPAKDVIALQYLVVLPKLEVQSTPVAGVSIAGAPAGTTNYGAELEEGTEVNLTAPLTHADGGTDYYFVRWVLDDVDQPAGEPTLTFNIVDDALAMAVYHIVQRTLTVQSTPITGVSITGAPEVLGGDTNYSRAVDDNMEVILTAPAAHADGGTDYEFVRWRLDGEDQPLDQRTLSFHINADATAVAVYRIVERTLTVQSTPVTGVSITGAPEALSGVTNYSVVLEDNSQVTLTAPAGHADGETDYEFVRWTLNGVNQPDGQLAVGFQIGGNTTAVAVYRAVQRALTVESTPITGVSIASVPEAAGGVTNYTADMDDNSELSLTAPAEHADGETDYEFVRWVLAGEEQPVGQRTLTFNINEDTTAVALYQIVQRTLTVESTPMAGVAITGDPEAAGGVTDYGLELDDNSEVSLTAPDSVLHEGAHYEFLRWNLNGADQPDGQNEVALRINEDTTAVAVYQIVQRTLTVQSTPITDVSITGDPEGAGGVTNYQVSLDDNSQVSLTAPESLWQGGGRYAFVRWVLGGNPQPDHQTTVAFRINGDTTALADYSQQVGLIASRRVDGVLISFYDIDLSNGVISPIIAWSPRQFRRGVTDILVHPGRIGDRIISFIALYGDGAETADLGVVLEDNAALMRFLDRRHGTPPLGFLLSEGRVGAVNLRAGVDGTDLGGFLAEGGWNLPADIDGDGDADDLTGFHSGGRLGALVASGNVNGDLVVAGDVRTLQIIGGDLNGDLVLTGSDIGKVVVRAGYDRAAREWRGGSVEGDIRSSSGGIGWVCAVGGDIKGDIEAAKGAIVKVAASAVRDGAEWRGGAIGGSIGAAGNVGVVSALGGDITGDVSARGHITSVSARAVFGRDGWQGGAIGGDVSASRSIRTVSAVGGDITGDITSTGSGITAVRASALYDRVRRTYSGGSVAGDIAARLWLSSLYAFGDLTGGVDVGSLGKVTVCGDFNGGSIDVSVGGFTSLWVLGNVEDAAITVNAFFRGMYVGGDFQNSTIHAGGLGRALVRSDLSQSTVNIGQGSLGSLWSGGSVRDSEINSESALWLLAVEGGIRRSNIQAGVLGVVTVKRGLGAGAGGPYFIRDNAGPDGDDDRWLLVVGHAREWIEGEKAYLDAAE